MNVDLFLSAQQFIHKNEPLKLCFDIDGIIAEKTKNNDYSSARPIPENISIINSLYERGHTVILFTARGSETGLDWTDATARQMHAWGLKFHSVKFGKPNAHIYIDDKNFSIAGLKQLFNIEEA